jgi:hypothetical protein
MLTACVDKFMKQRALGNKTNQQMKRAIQQNSSAGAGAIGIAPPAYGIDFVDRGLAAGFRSGSIASVAASVQRQPIPEEEELLQGKFDAAVVRVNDDARLEKEAEAMGQNASYLGWVHSPQSLTPFPIRRAAATIAGVERATGYDLSGVRVHERSRLADASGVHGLTMGADVHLASSLAGEGTAHFDHVLRHELAHAVQREAPPRAPRARWACGRSARPRGPRRTPTIPATTAASPCAASSAPASRIRRSDRSTPPTGSAISRRRIRCSATPSSAGRR